MKFYINEEQKIRLSISESASCVISDDMEYYGISKPATFINIVFSNFYPSARSSVSLRLEAKSEELERIFASLKLDRKTKDSVISALLSEEEEKLLRETESFRSVKGISKLYRMNGRNTAYLSDNCPEEKYYANPAQYIKSILEEYCSLPFIERDRIFHKEHYQNIETACKQKRILKIKVPCYINGVPENRTYQVHPYKIVSDPFHIQSYLVCRSKLLGEEESSRKLASFTISRLQEPPAVMDTKFFISSREVKELEERLLHHTPAFMIEEIDEIHVRLTAKGKRSFQNRRYSRPIKDETLSTEDEYVFFCPSQQAYNYFIGFGPEAEILRPLLLRERFITTFKNALNKYE